ENKCIDECDILSQNPCNSPDNKFRCCKQDDKIYRCVIANCCTNEDCKLPDKPYCEKALETPDCVNLCNPNTGIKCGEKYICCYAFNGYMCFAGECCESKECLDSKKCIGHHCVEEDCKAEPTICNADEKCCQAGQIDGVCYKGECCYDGDCLNNINGTRCLIDIFKCGCTVASDCKSGYVCKSGICVKGDCITHADCKDPAKPICNNNKCSTCQLGEQCKNAQKGDICCGGQCKYGDCCQSLPDCEAYVTNPVCRNGFCSPCINAEECKSNNLGENCCTKGALAGDCYTGACCSSYDCLAAGNVAKPICHTLDYNCYPCKSDTECQNEFNNNSFKCCTVKSSSLAGSCYKGECCDDTQCAIYQGRPKCNLETNTCVECIKKEDCGILGTNFVCCNNQCIKGECCNSQNCIAQNKGNFCYDYHCRQQCKTTDECTGFSIYKECCTNLKTDPFPFCVNELKGRCCKYDSDCDNLSKCCFGICIPKINICN
ncbi:MAG: hypothetical protein N3B13_02235, partial [Deltaproteobacteria bacterium]|nr:hypothetical protein [Deltaproteobacteria bacterium]